MSCRGVRLVIAACLLCLLSAPFLVCHVLHADTRAQDQTVSFVAEMVQSNGFANPSTLFLVGTYTIGKEEVFLAPARACGWKVRSHV